MSHDNTLIEAHYIDIAEGVGACLGWLGYQMHALHWMMYG